MKRWIALLSLCCLTALLGFGQGLETTASKDDWEEINFEFNSPILTDGYPSLLRLAELLRNNPQYRIRVEGHADSIGGNRYNDRLGQRRAETVRSFLTKYGAAANQVTVETRGEQAPKVPNRTKEGRFMNRRVIFTVTDAQGNPITMANAMGPQRNEATIADVIRKLDELSSKQDATRDAILRRLDQLDQIAAAITKLAGQNDQLQQRVQALEQGTTQIRERVETLPNRQETATIVDTRLEANRDRRYGTINLAAGADDNRNLTLSGRGKAFFPFKDRVAIQAGGEYTYFRTHQEGQGDVGLVSRVGNFQAGMFSSIKYVNLRQDTGERLSFLSPAGLFNSQASGSGFLGQFAFLGDVLFPRGKAGIFVTRKFRDNVVLGRSPVQQFLTFPGATASTLVRSSNLFNETYLGVLNQFGGQATVGLVGDTYLEANFAGLRSEFNRNYRAGGGARLVLPFSDRFAFTIEGDLNPTLVGATNSTRILAGLQFGNFIRPKEFAGLTTPVPMDIPRVRFEVLTRTVREGNGVPVADAGGDRIGVAAGQVTLDGSRSFDPDGDAITFQWDQIAGPSVALSGANTSRVTFTAAEGQTYSFRLTVTDSQGSRAIDRATVTTEQVRQVRVLSFTAVPNVINAGQTSTLTYQVENADTVTIDGIGNVNPQGGSTQVSPAQTTTYTLRARGRSGEVVQTVTVTVNRPEARFLACTVSPMNITVGQSAQIVYATEGATSVSIDQGIGTVATSGTRSVSPTQTTTYNLTATNAAGSANCSVTVQVTAAPVARIVRFSAVPATINRGERSTLLYAVEGADTITISGIGTVPGPTGTVEVTPNDTTVYTLTATNASGSVTAQATVTVNVPTILPTLTACTVSPTTAINAGQSAVLNFTAANATSVSISPGIGVVPVGGGVTVRPTQTTTYTVTATGANNQTASCAIVVTVNAVGVAPTLANCSATPASPAAAGDPVVLNFTATNATSVSIAPGVGTVPTAGGVTVRPTQTTTYTVTAVGANNQTAACTIAVTIPTTPPPPPPPVAIIAGGPLIDVLQREITLDASGSTDPQNGPLTYFWESIGSPVAILDQGLPRTRIQFPDINADYGIRLTVRNQQGQTGSAVVTLRFRGVQNPQ